MFIKKGDATEIRMKDFSSIEHRISPSILNNFTKQARDIKKIAPKASEFLYFSTVMMHAAEASLLNDDGSLKTHNGKNVEASWDTSTGSYIWKCSDDGIQPYRNQRGDIFPESELIKAHSEWVGKPLCIDHKSDSVDHTRGFIVDTFYDYDLKRVVALCALDKKSYPELAHKVSSGVSNCVSMGTGVGRAVCTEKGCYKVASKANEFCTHMKFKSGYGEVNLDLSPIELSIVVAGADKKATIKHIIASVNTLNSYVESKESLIKSGSKETDVATGLIDDIRKLIDKAGLELDEVNLEGSEKDDVISTEPIDDSLESSDVEEIEEPSGEMGASPSSARLASLDLKLTSMIKKVANSSLNSLNKQASALSQAVKYASDNFSVSLNFRNDENHESKSMDFESNKLDEVKEFLEKAVGEFEELEKEASDLEAEHLDDDKKETFASFMDNINNEISSLTKLYNYTVKGHNMAIDKKAYFNGGGGVNEPTPGKVKYTPDPMNEDLRKKDHHMQGAKPFPEVGDVEGLYGDDLEFKKKLSRAEAEERALKRAAIVSAAKDVVAKKEAYFLGGGGVNEPTPGKVKYAPDPMNEALRKKDHHMQGAKPFPEVGNVEGLYGDDLELKKKILRASTVKASLVKSANAELGDYTWKVTNADGEVIFRDTVKTLAKGDELLFTSVASREYGEGLMKRVQASVIRKLAQAAPVPAPVPAPAPSPAAPADANAIPPAGDVSAEMPMDMPMGDGAPEGEVGLEGEEEPKDIKDVVKDLSEQIRDLSSDLVEAIQSLLGEQAKMGEVAPKLASSPFYHATREANLALTDVMSDQVSELQERLEELSNVRKIASQKLSKTASKDAKELFVQIAEASFEESEVSLAQGKALMGSFIKYSRGAQSLAKQAQLDAELDSSMGDVDFESDEEETGEDLDVTSDASTGDERSLEDILSEVDGTFKGKKSTDEQLSDDMFDVDMADDEDLEEALALADEDYIEEDLDKDDMDEDLDEDSLLADMVEVTTPDGKKVTAPAGSEVKTASRVQMRAKIAAKAMQLAGVAGALSPSTKIEGIDSSEAVSENIVDQQKQTMDLVLGKVKVRKEAERIHALVAQGELSESDVGGLVAHGVDPEVVKYYREMYADGDSDAKEFASELASEKLKAQASDAIETHKVKVSRAYDLVHEMVSKGLVDNDREIISARVDELASGSDDAFNQLRRVVATVESKAGLTNIPVRGMMPQNGLIREASVEAGKPVDLVSQYLSALQGGKSHRSSR